MRTGWEGVGGGGWMVWEWWRGGTVGGCWWRYGEDEGRGTEEEVGVKRRVWVVGDGGEK